MLSLARCRNRRRRRQRRYQLRNESPSRQQAGPLSLCTNYKQSSICKLWGRFRSRDIVKQGLSFWPACLEVGRAREVCRQGLRNAHKKLSLSTPPLRSDQEGSMRSPCRPFEANDRVMSQKGWEADDGRIWVENDSRCGVRCIIAWN